MGIVITQKANDTNILTVHHIKILIQAIWRMQVDIAPRLPIGFFHIASFSEFFFRFDFLQIADFY